MRARVARADDSTRITPHLHACLPRLVVVGPNWEAESGHEIVGDDDVAQDVELVLAFFGRDLAHLSAFVACVVRRERLVDDVDAPVRHVESSRRLLRGLSEHPPAVDRREHRLLLVVRERHGLLPARDRVEQEAAVEADAR